MAHMQYGYKVRIKETGYIWVEFWMVLILQRRDSIGTQLFTHIQIITNKFNFIFLEL